MTLSTDDRLVFVESVDASGDASKSPLEYLRVCAAIAAERGFLAESIVRTASGVVLTPVGFHDLAFDRNLTSGRVVAVRCLEASSAWGLPAGADYIAHHWSLASVTDPEHFARLEFPVWGQLYAGEVGDDWGQLARPVSMYGSVCDVRFTPDGRHAITLQFFRDPIRETYGVFDHDLASGDLRLVCRMAGDAGVSGDLTISPDGRYALAGSPSPQLVDLHTGHCAGWGGKGRSATWYPSAGPSCVLQACGGDFEGPWWLEVVDLSTFDTQRLAELPRRVDGLQVAHDGTIAARMNAYEETGWFDELVVSTDNGRSFTPVAPLYGASGRRRRRTRPRFIEPALDAPSKVCLNSGFEEFLRGVKPDNAVVPEEIGWVLDTVVPLIKHRVHRLGEESEAVDAILDQLSVLTGLAAQLDPEMRDAVAAQVVPVAIVAARSAQGRTQTEHIAAVAEDRAAPAFRVKFGS